LEHSREETQNEIQSQDSREEKKVFSLLRLDKLPELRKEQLYPNRHNLTEYKLEYKLAQTSTRDLTKWRHFKSVSDFASESGNLALVEETMGVREQHIVYRKLLFIQGDVLKEDQAK